MSRIRTWILIGAAIFVGILGARDVAAQADGDDGRPADPLAEYFREGNVYDGDDVRQRLRDGRQSFQRAQYDEARLAFETAAALSPEHVVVLHLLGLAHVALGNVADAERVQRRALSLFPGWRRLQFDLAGEFGEHFETLDRRLAQLRDAVRQDADRPDADRAPAMFVLAYLQFFDGEFESAMHLFHRLAQADPTDAVSAGFLHVLEEAGFVVPRPDPPRAFGYSADKRWLLPGLTELARRRYGEAAVAFGEAGMGRTDGDAYSWMSVAFVGENRVDLAASMLARAIELGAPGLVDMPPARDLLGAELMERRWRQLREASDASTQRLVFGWLAFLEADVPVAREALAQLARPAPGEGATYLEVAAALLRRLPERENPPRVDLAALVAEGARGDTAPADDHGDDPPTPDVRRDPPAHEPGSADDDAPGERTLAEARAEIRRLTDEGDEALAHESFAVARDRFRAAYRLGRETSEAFYDDPRNLNVLIKLSRAHFALGEFADATETLQRYLVGSPEPIRRQAGGYPAPFERETFDRALQRLERRVRNESDDAAARFLLAYVSFSRMEYDRAYTQFMLLGPADEATHPLVAYYVELLEQPQYTGGSSGQGDGDAIERLIARGRDLLSATAYRQATSVLRRAYERRADAESVRLLLVALWGQAIALGRASSDSDDIAARIAVFRDFAQTLRSFLRAEGDDNWRDLTLDFAGAFRDAIEYERAREVLERHVDERRLDFEGLYVLAFVQYFAGEYAQAEQSLLDYRRTRRNGEPGPEYEWFLQAARRAQ